MQIDVSGASWVRAGQEAWGALPAPRTHLCLALLLLLAQPPLSPSTYYWFALSPRVPLTVPSGSGGFNGVLWGGVNTSTGLLPGPVSGDTHLFTGRALTSQRSAGDSAFAASTAAAVNLTSLRGGWAGVPNASVRYTNWAAIGAGSAIRYGIQVRAAPLPPALPVACSHCRVAPPGRR